jgi:hypothetical protein
MGCDCQLNFGVGAGIIRHRTADERKNRLWKAPGGNSYTFNNYIKERLMKEGDDSAWDFSFFSSRVDSVPDLMEDSQRVWKNGGRIKKLAETGNRRPIDEKELNLRWRAVGADVPTVAAELVRLTRVASYTRDYAKERTKEADKAEKEGRKSPCFCSIL